MTIPTTQQQQSSSIYLTDWDVNKTLLCLTNIFQKNCLRIEVLNSFKELHIISISVISGQYRIHRAKFTRFKLLLIIFKQTEHYIKTIWSSFAVFTNKQKKKKNASFSKLAGFCSSPSLFTCYTTLRGDVKTWRAGVELVTLRNGDRSYRWTQSSVFEEFVAKSSRNIDKRNQQRRSQPTGRDHSSQRMKVSTC